MVYKQLTHWIDVLKPFVESYNHTYYRGIGTYPADVTSANEGEILARTLYSPAKFR